MHPALYTGPRMVKPPAVYTAGLLRGIGRGIDTTEWAWLAGMAGQRLFMPPNVAGWDDERWLDTATFRGRWWVANYATRPYSLTEKQAASVPSAPEALVEGAVAFWGSPTLRPETRARAARVRAPCDGRREPELEEALLSRPGRERAAPARRHLPRPPDLLTPMARCCSDFSRTDLVRRGLAEAGRGLPAIEAGHAGAGGNGALAPELPRPGAGSRARDLRWSAGAAARARGGDRGRRRCRTAARARLGLPRRWRRLALDALPRRRSALPAAAAAARAARFGRRRLRRGRRLRWHPSLAALATLHGEGKVTVLPGVGYTGPDQSHFTSRHFWEVGATSEQPPHGLARSLARPRRLARQPTPGPVARIAASARARHGPSCPSPRSTGPTATTSGRATSGATSSSACSRRSASLGALPTGGDAALAQATAAARQSAQLRRQLLPFTPEGRGPASRARSRTRARTKTTSRAASPASPRCSAPACPCVPSR